MKEWFTPAELAELHLPGVANTDRGVRIQAPRENWQFRPRQARGGGREYHVSSLPEQARIELARRQAENHLMRGVAVAASQAHNLEVAGSSPAPATKLNPKQQVRAEARLTIVAACDQFIQDGFLPRSSGTAAFARLYPHGLHLPTQVAAAVPTLCANSIHNWRRKIKKEGTAALAGKHGQHRKGTSRIDQDADIKDLVVGMLAGMPHIDAKQIIRAIRTRFKSTGKSLPSYRSVQRYVKTWKDDNAQIFQAVTDPDKFRSKYQAAFGSASERVIGLNHVWEIDSTIADVKTKDGRQALVALIDVWSRRAMILVAPTSKAVAITALLRRAIMAWGVPAEVKTDNGADYVSFHVKRALADLQIKHTLCPPYSPERKPHIERFIGRLSHEFLELLPGYIGHNVTDRKAIENRKSFGARMGDDESVTFSIEMTAADLQAKVDLWAHHVYEREPHRSLDGMSPFEKAATWTSPVARIENERALDVLLAEAPGEGVRTVRKSGIHLDNAVFIHPELGAYVGAKVQIRYDAADMGRVYVFDANEGHFICAAECPDRTGISREAAATHARNLQKQVISAGKKELRATVKRIKPETVAEELIAAGQNESNIVVALPRAGDAHETDALNAAAIAVIEHNGPKHFKELTIEEREAADALWARYNSDDEDAGTGTGDTESKVTKVDFGARAAAESERPIFTDDRAWALWVLNNPEEADDDERAEVTRRMKSTTFRQWVGMGEKESRLG